MLELFKIRRREEEEERKPPSEALALENRKPPVNGEQRVVSLSFSCLSGFPSALLFSFLKSDIPGWFVCLSLSCGDSGMVICSALHYLWSVNRHPSRRGGSQHPGARKVSAGLCLVQPPRGLQRACSARAPVRGSLSHVHCQVRTRLRCWLYCALSDPFCAPPPTRVHVSAHPPCPGEAGAVSDVSWTAQGCRRLPLRQSL